jgi:hypothetical protein
MTRGIPLIKSNVCCDECGAGFHRIELVSRPSEKGEYRCPLCQTILEVFDGTHSILYRVTVAPRQSPFVKSMD